MGSTGRWVFLQKPILNLLNPTVNIFLWQNDGVRLLMAETLHQLRLVVFPIIYRVSYIPGGAGFQPSTGSLGFGIFKQVPGSGFGGEKGNESIPKWS